MKENYILAAFRKTAAQQFPERRTELNEKLAARIAALRAEHADAPKPVSYTHLIGVGIRLERDEVIGVLFHLRERCV